MYIIGDVHGCYKTLIALVEKLPKDEQILFTGDLIDRGPSSKEVIQWMIDHSNKCRSVIGNHEQMLLKVRNLPKMSNTMMWSWNGGENTLDSYFPKTKEKSYFEEETEDDLKNEEDLLHLRRSVAIPQEHLDFFSGMPQYIEEGDLFVSHSSWNTAIPWENVLELDDASGHFKGLTWHRGVPGKLPDGRFHVFGHTPIAQPDIKDYYANIDTGAVFLGGKYGGILTAIHYPTMDVYQQDNLDFPDRLVA